MTLADFHAWLGCNLHLPLDAVREALDRIDPPPPKPQQTEDWSYPEVGGDCEI